MTTIVFDVNETLLDLAVLDKYFAQFFGNVQVRGAWFQQVLQVALVTTILGTSKDFDFGQVGRIALEMTCKRHEVELSDEEIDMIISTMSALPPYPEVEAGIKRLHEAGFRLAALTNSPQGAAEKKLDAAGLAQYMDKIMSVQAVGKFKPAIEVYQMAQEQLGETGDNLWMVAAHEWDLAGAMNAGWHGAFIARPGKVYHERLLKPDIVGKDLTEVVEKVLNL
jgi:2-haloacid dehalogenase